MAKAVTRHVKAKTAWKTVEIPRHLVDDDLFDGLIDVQELTDYELVAGLDVPEEVSSTKSKRTRKRKKKNEVESSPCEPLEEKLVTDHPSGGDISATSEPKAKKRKKMKKTITNAHNLVEASNIIDINISDVDQSDPLKSDNIDVPQTSEDENMNQKKQERRKKKKKKKKKPSESQKNIGLTRKVGENEPHEGEAVTVQNTTDIDMSQWKNLFVPEELMCSLQEQGFVNPTEIQLLTLPSAIRDKRDILGAAETGSGKTLAFGIPVLAQILALQGLESKDDAMEKESDDSDISANEEITDKISSTEKPSECGPKALILEPTRELAVQVRKHLTRLASHTSIKFATVVGGMSVDKQYRILKQAPEVVIATPGRLWQLIEQGEEHLSRVDCVHSLVVDEADRMVEKGHYEELTKLLHYINESPRRVKKRQTYVMSATLTMDIALPHRVKNKVKKKKSQEESKLNSLTEKICVGAKPKIIDLTTKDKVAQTLTELRINSALDEKDFYLFYFLCQHPGRTLVFVNSKDCLRRLVSLFTLLQCSPLPLHADMHQTQRLKNLDRFAGESKTLLIASDVAARGLDIKNIDHVIHYQVPRTVENYVHRSGRTARASKQGLTVMFVGAEDARNYRKIVQVVKNGKEVPIMPLDLDLMPAVKKRVEMARSIDVKEHRSKKKKSQNNFFQKAAQDMDMILDDDKLLLDLGSAVEQSQEKQNLKSMKQQLVALLKRPLAPLLMTKYPTKSGQLMSKKVINLHDVS